MTIEHSVLTGAALHEPKGVAAATANTVYVADGVGSGTWTTITNPFSTGLLHVREEQTSGTQGSTLTSGWNTRVLNSVKTNEIPGTALSSNQITGLPSGTYWIDATAISWTQGGNAPSQSFSGTGVHTLRLQNITSGSTLLVSLTYPFGESRVEVAAGVNHRLTIPQVIRLAGRFTLGSTSTVALQHAFTQGTGTNVPNSVIAGKAASIASTNEVYADVMIWKL